MNTLRYSLVILVLILTVHLSFAQETDIPKPTETVAAEATVEPVPVVEPVETVDQVNWLDDILEALGKLDVATLALGIALVTFVLRIRTPQTSAEKQLNDETLALREAEAKQTASQLDDLLVTLSRLANNLRPIADSLSATGTAQLTNVSSGADTVITTTTATTIDSNDVELRG